MHIDPDFSDSDDDERVVGYTKGKIYHNNYACTCTILMVIITKFIAGYKKEDLLTPDIIIRAEEKATSESVILYLPV